MEICGKGVLEQRGGKGAMDAAVQKSDEEFQWKFFDPMICIGVLNDNVRFALGGMGRITGAA